MQFLILVSLMGCASSEEKSDIHKPFSRILKSSFDQTWRAAQQAFLKYPLRVNNMDTGTLETQPLKGVNAYTPPHIEKKLASGYEYFITLKVVQMQKNPPLTRIVLEKENSKKTDFFSESKPIPSDGFEEKKLIYRIKRELYIEGLIENLSD